MGEPATVPSPSGVGLADYKLPKSVDVWPELPKGATGKILKRRIVEACRANEQA